MMKRRVLLLLQRITFLFIALQCVSSEGSQVGGLSAGMKLPPFMLPSPDSEETREYLGLGAMGPFTLSDIDSKLVLIEFMSVTCVACNLNAPVTNRLYNVILKDPLLAKSVKMIGVAFGNSDREILAFKNKHKTRFPVFPDEECAIAVAVGLMQTPVMVLTTTRGDILTSHEGSIRDFDGFLRELRDICKKR
ncbi:MAG: TlpA family protein disulfide reductase [Deltaproteobacteria bacterium]|nr:TlpA family protein disulfide reductase [Deltaproteobacteria bacterium]